MKRYTVHARTGHFISDHARKVDAMVAARDGATVIDRNQKRVVYTAPVQMKDRLHYTTSTTPTARLCGAPGEEWGTVDLLAVTCPDCVAVVVLRKAADIIAALSTKTTPVEPEPAPEPVKPPPEPEHGTLAGPGFTSWAPQVIADGSGQWAGNALRFATKEEAEANVRNLSWRWMLVRETRVIESDDEVNYQWDVERGLVPCITTKGAEMLSTLITTTTKEG